MSARRSAIFRIASASLAIGANAPVFAIPWRSLAGVKNANLAAAGRCISVSTDMWDITRCSHRGHDRPSRGLGAALAARRRKRWVQLPIALLQEALRANGAIVEAP